MGRELQLAGQLAVSWVLARRWTVVLNCQCAARCSPHRLLPLRLALPCLPLPAPTVIANLEHRHSYVRKNAVLALAAIFRLPKGELLVPDAPELVDKMLQNEQVRGGQCSAGLGWAGPSVEAWKVVLELAGGSCPILCGCLQWLCACKFGPHNTQFPPNSPTSPFPLVSAGPEHTAQRLPHAG